MLQRLIDFVLKLEPELRAQGFSRYDERFVTILPEDNLGLIEFQRSLKGARGDFAFTINLGIFVAGLQDGTARQIGPSQLVSERCHVRRRVGFLLHGRKDKWWQISPTTDLQSLTLTIQAVLGTAAIPWIRAFSSTSVVLEMWQRGESPGLTQRQCQSLLEILKRGN